MAIKCLIHENSCDNVENCTVIQDTLRKASNLSHYMHDIAEDLSARSSILISDIVTDVEDARLNSVAFSLDNQHVRYYTTREIINSAAEYEMHLEYYKQVDEVISGDNLLPYKDFINKVPVKIAKNLKAIYNDDGDCTQFSLKRGLFVFKKA